MPFWIFGSMQSITIRLYVVLIPVRLFTSEIRPAIHFFSYQYLAERWQQSKSSVSRLLKKLENNDMITLISYSGKHGSMIYLNNYLSVMFNISDVMIDKEEIAMKMELPIHIPDEVAT